MTPRLPPHGWKELAALVAIAVAAALAAAAWDLAERFYEWTRPLEPLNVDEWMIATAVLLAGLVWFALRRYREARRLGEAAQAEEARLADTLAVQRQWAQRYVRLQEAERKALARDLHDELGQCLNLIQLDAVALRDDPNASPAARRKAAAIVGNADRAYESLGALVRRLRPVGLDELGLPAALEHLVASARARSPGTQISLTIDTGLDGLGDETELTLYRLVQEGLTNCAKHAQARRIEIVLAAPPQAADGMLALTIRDDGIGCAAPARADGVGLVGMRERVLALGGTLAVETAPGAGFCVRAELPCRYREAAA
ncbi:MAG: sensor histidine kinase [Burkholderiaceae bacterium]|nr:sensor histidine kinase [Burkholderiaceae bacterium]